MTLIEVLVALMILSVVCVSAMQTSTQQIKELTTLEKKEFALLIAGNELSQLTLRNAWPESSWSRGQTEMAGQIWFWQWRGIPTGNPDIRTLEIEVRLADTTQPLARLKTLRVRPYD